MKTTHKVLSTAVSLSLIFSIIFFTGCEKEVSDTEVNWLGDTLSTIDDNQKIGQLFCLSVDPISYFLYPTYQRNINTLIGKYKPGAIFLKANLDSVKLEIRNEFNGSKLHDEVVKMQNLSVIPLFITTNFESGAWYWDSKATRFPFPLALGASLSREFAYRQGKITSVEAKAQGINWLTAPAVNISIDPDNTLLQLQSFGNDPVLSADLGSRYIKGCQEVGIAACMKFFPNEAPQTLLTVSPDEIAPDQLDVFKSCVDSGVLSIMGSPIDLTDYDKLHERTISEHLISDMLRDRLGFNGLFVCKLITSNKPDYVIEEMNTLLETLKIGNNMFILPEVFGTDIPLLDILLNEMQSGNIDMKPVNVSAQKIVSMKNQLNLHLMKKIRLLRPMAGIGLPEYHQTSRDISNQCVTILKNENNIMPVDYQNTHTLTISFLDEFSPHYATIYENKVSQITENSRQINIFGIPDQRIQHEALRRAAEADVVICSFFLKPDNVTKTSDLPREIKNLMNLIKNVNDQIIITSFYDPYLLNHFPDARGYIIPYSPSQYSIHAAIEVIFGKRDAPGKLPLNISEKFPLGYGIHYTEGLLSN